MSRVWVVVYCLWVITWLIGIYSLVCEMACIYMIKCFILWLTLLQMREVLEVNRKKMILLHSLPGLVFFLLGFYPRAMAHVLFWLLVYHQLLLCPCTYFCIGIVVCLIPLLCPFEQLYGVRFILQDCAIIFLCDASLIRVIN